MSIITGVLVVASIGIVAAMEVSQHKAVESAYTSGQAYGRQQVLLEQEEDLAKQQEQASQVRTEADRQVADMAEQHVKLQEKYDELVASQAGRGGALCLDVDSVRKLDALRSIPTPSKRPRS
jgi:uncharacterized protein (UPF0254 family)